MNAYMFALYILLLVVVLYLIGIICLVRAKTPRMMRVHFAETTGRLTHISTLTPGFYCRCPDPRVAIVVPIYGDKDTPIAVWDSKEIGEKFLKFETGAVQTTERRSEYSFLEEE